jgi:hypothetical protein
MLPPYPPLAERDLRIVPVRRLLPPYRALRYSIVRNPGKA